MADEQVCITIRIIKNFEYRLYKNIVIPVNTTSTTVGALKELCLKRINTDSKFKPYRGIKYDTLKLYTQAFGNKTQNLVINTDDIGFLDDMLFLKDAGIRKETEISFFNRKSYNAYIMNPQMLW
ncbi:hypothetical protein COEREDRAFT_84995 [Coemansia reversa NRRL 1564]|uniref:Uncharacterized protein n=1 Tax=Coemansia reversa (strain ATCC 12441 / NRRL 1564) TaxID=763665 RepID=A0A2G5BJ91_COERN|nr:hypothetical protein COEREDRAFT_84995 [Coemansia reversa NRRL 1564]|eukprot:PIA19073.1 hypothetical protein COEREDRAFT_84995 [Coemansia reversa NRRL 1564]